MYVVVCEYEGYRHSDPLGQFHAEVVGPFEKYTDAVEYEETHRYEGCGVHSILPLIEVN